MSLDEKLNGIANLQFDWGDRGERAPSQAAIRTARNFTAVPMSNGRVQLELHAGGVDLEIEIDTDGQISSVMWSRSER